MHLIPKNWADFQHYKDRSPPWVKLHKTILEDRDFSRLPIASKALAPMLWLLASESKSGSFDASIDELVFRLRWTEKDIQAGLKPLIDIGLFIVDSTVLAECVQVAVPEAETETEAETEAEAENHPPVFNPSNYLQSLGAEKDLAKEFLAIRKIKKKQNTERAIKPITEQMLKHNKNINAALELCCQKTWADFNAGWDLSVGKRSADNSTAYNRKMKTLAGLTGGILGNSSDAQFQPIIESNTIDMERSNANLLG
jgi:hypothetical protein